MRCLILDDEKSARAGMRLLLTQHPDVKVVGEAGTVQEALEVFLREGPDLVFLDIQLRKETGFDFLERLKGPRPRLVFVTEEERQAIRVFDCNALDCLLKPIRPERLAETLRRARAAPSPPCAIRMDQRVPVKMSNTTRFVPWNEILTIKSEGNYSQLFLKDGTTPLILRPLKEWERIAPPGHFLQAHRTILVST